MNIPPPPGILTDEEFAAIQAAGGPQAAPPEDRDWMAAQVNQYKAFRISAPRDEDIAARTASRNFLDKLTLDPDNIASANGIDLIAKAPPEQQAATRDRLVVDAWLTDRLRAQTVITPDGTTPTPELDPMRRDEYRDALAQELFGDSAPRGSDAAVVAQLRTKADERRRHRVLIGGQDGTDDAAKAATAASLARWAARSAYAGESAVQGFAKWKQQARTSANWTPIAEKQALFDAWAQVYGETKARVAPYQAAVRQTLDNLKALAEAKDVLGMPNQSPQKFDEAIRPLMGLDEQTLRNIALPALRSMAELETKAGGTGSFWDEMKAQLGKSFMRPFGQGVGAVRQQAMTVGAGQGAALAENPLAAMGVIPFTPEEAQKVGTAVDKAQGENLARTMLRSALTTDIDPIKPNAESAMGKRLEQMAYDVAGTAAYMTMLSVPYAGTAMATASFADDNTAMLLNKHPDMKASDARAIAAVAAPIQTAIEQLQRLQVFGKVPVFNKVMNRLAGPGGNAAVRFGIYGTVGALVEYTEEKLQDAAPLAVQALASALKQDIPQANLDGFELLDLRTFLAVAPFALIGAGVNVSQDKAAMRLMVSDEAAMRAVGISEDGIQSIQAAGTVEAQTQAIQQAWSARDTTAPADERWQETVRKAAAESQAAAMNEAAAMQQAAGVQEVKRATDGSMHITLGDGTVAVAGDAVEAQAIIEGATEAAQGWDDLKPLTDMIDALDARPDAAVGAIDATFEERANVADLITRYTDAANDEALPQAERDAAANYVQSLQQRAAIYEAQNPGQKVDWRKVTVAGQSDMQAREGVATAIIRVDKGASPYVVLEETVEADFAAMEQSGEMTQADAVKELRDLERRTGDAYLSAWTGTNPAADRLAIVEGLSKAAQIYATGKARAGGETGSRAAGVLREWRKAQRGKLMQAEREGVAPKVIAYLKQKAEWLRAVIGQAIRMNRARREAQAAGETFPLERFLQRVTGVAVETQAAEEVTDAASEMWDDEGLSYIPPEDDELTPFSFQPTAETPRATVTEKGEGYSETMLPDGARLQGPALFSFSFTAYHGTPHKVDRFSLDKIGTGEGAQAYGWGLYFAESRGIAEWYRDTLAKQSTGPTYLGEDQKSWRNATGMPQRGDVLYILGLMEDQSWTAEQAFDYIRENEETVDDSIDPSDFKEGRSGTPGNLYAVEIAPDDADFLDWDAAPSDSILDKIAAYYVEAGLVDLDLEDARAELEDLRSGAELYGKMSEGIGPQEASKQMLAAGIPGIRYLDAGSRAAGTGSRNYVLFDDGLVRILEENGKPVEQALTSFSFVQAEYLRNDKRFDKLRKAGRIRIGADIEDFTDQHILLHWPDTAFAGTLRLPGGEVIEGKGGVYYPVIYAAENYFWASTKNNAEATAQHLNTIGKKNGGRILMGLLSADVEKLFSSTTMATAQVVFLRSLLAVNGAGITEAVLNKMLVTASRAKVIKETTNKNTGEKKKKVEEFEFTLNPAASYQETMKRIPDLLQPDAGTFGVRKAFSTSLATQLAGLMAKKPKSAAIIAKILSDAENRHAKKAILSGKLSTTAIMQGLGNLLTEPFLRTFQQHEKTGQVGGQVYAVVEVAGPVKAIPSDKHESYPYAIVPTNPKNKVKVTILREAMDWQTVVGKESGEYVTDAERKSYMPTTGISKTSLKVLGRAEETQTTELGFSFQPSKERPSRKPTKEEARRKALRPRLTKAILTAMAIEQADWRDWYSRHKEVLDEYFGDHADIFQKFLSATSQASSVKGNVTFALKAYGQWLRGEPFNGFLDAVKMNLERVRREEQLSGRKISTYDRANRGSEEVVVDRHIAMLLFKTKTPTAAQFDKAQRILTDIAAKIGWNSHQVQAALWAASIVRSGKTPVSYDSYLSTLDARGAIAGIIGGGVAPVGGGGRYESRGIGSGASGGSDADGQISFSFQPTAILDDLANKVEARMSRSPQARLDAVRAAVENLAALKRAWQKRRDGAGIGDDRSKASIDAEADVRQAFRAAELMQAAGISYATAREIVEGRRRTYEETLARETHARGIQDRTAQAIRKEAAVRQAFKRDELLQKVDEDFAQTLSAVYRDFGFWDGPALNFLSRQEGGSRKGTLLSYSKAKRYAGKGAYVNPAVWDGSHELPRSLFAGTMQPDVAAQELFSAHPELFPAGTTSADVTPDMMWDAIGRELRDNKKMMDATKAYQAATRATAEESREWAEQWEADYKAQLEAARMAADAAASAYVATATNGNEAAEKATAQAAKEAAAWKRKALTMQNQDWNNKETLVRAMRTLDAILSAFPAAVRGKVGGWLALARIGTQDRMAEEIDRRITILDRELERELRKDALEELDALRERAKPKREGGKKPVGKLGAEAHRFFERIEAVADLTADEVEAAGLTLDTLAAKAATPDEQADIYERQQILDYFGGLDARDAAGVPLHDAQALASALATAEHVYEWGRNQWRTQEEARLAEVQAMAQEVTAAVGAAPLSRILAQGDAAKKLSGMLRGGSVSLRSFREVLHLIMGRDNPLAKQWADRAMDAMHARTDELADIRRRWRAAMEAATGQRRHKAEARVWEMGTKRTVAVTVRPGRPISDVIPIDAIPNLAGLGYNAAEIADAQAAFLALPADSRAKNITITRWQKDTEEAVSLTDAEAVYYSMLWRQEQYRENLNRAGLGQETQDEIEAGMSDAAKSLREFMAAEYTAGYYSLASLFRGMFGVDLPQIANYAPGKWWSRGVEKPMDPSGAGMVEGGFRAGMFKDRKAHLAEPKPENAFALWLGHVSQTAHWKAVAPLARELRGVFGHPEVKKAITARHGAETLEALSRWLDAIEANGVKTNFPAWAQTLLGWQANVKLAWKVGTILKQSTGLIAAAYRMPLKAYASGMRRLITGQIDVQDVWGSPMIQRRLESGFAPEVRAAMSRTFTDAPTLRRRFVQQGMELIGYADAFFATASAAIHYDWQLSQIREAVPGISDAAAKAHAMRETQLVVNATAQPVEITERSLVEMGGFGKVFLIFGSEARQKSSMWITAWARVLRKQATEEDWRTLAIMHLIVGPMVQVISSAWMDARDDDDDEWFDEKNWSAWDFIRSAALGPMAGIPIIRDLTDGFSGDSGPTAQTAKAMQSAVRIVKGPEDSEDETVEWYAQRTAEILKGADSFTAVVAGIGEQAFRISDNVFDTREEIQGKIDTLTRKLGRTKDDAERQELLERIAGLRERLK